jgi:hypothetical protein
MRDWIIIIVSGFQEMFKDISSYFRESLAMNELGEERASYVRYYIGYGLLIWTLIDLIWMIIPPRLTNVIWELSIMEGLVQKLILPFFIAIGLIFYREKGQIRIFELILLKWVSWLCLILGIIYFLIIPWSIANTVRLYHNKRVEIISQNTQLSQVEDFKKKLNTATTENEIKELIKQQFPNAKTPEKIDNIEQYKKNILTNFSKLDENLKRQIQAQETQLKSAIKVLIKNLSKLILSAFIAGFVFLSTWFFTDWARVDIE